MLLNKTNRKRKFDEITTNKTNQIQQQKPTIRCKLYHPHFELEIDIEDNEENRQRIYNGVYYEDANNMEQQIKKDAENQCDKNDKK